MTNEVELSRRESILTVTLNRPEKRNAMSSAMLRRLVEVFDGMAAETEVRVLVLRGAGRSFCAGLDLEEMARTKAASAQTQMVAIGFGKRALGW